MGNSIQLSPNHGVNPTIPVCAFCGQEKNELALMGRLKGDAKAPMHAIINYEPCDECRENWSQGIPLIRVTTKQPMENMPPLTKRSGKNIYPTGQYAVITTEAAKRIFDHDAPAGSPIMLDEEVFDNFMKQAEAAEGSGSDEAN